MTKYGIKTAYNWIAEVARLIPEAKFSPPNITYRDGKTRVKVTVHNDEQNFVISNHPPSEPATPQEVKEHFDRDVRAKLPDVEESPTDKIRRHLHTQDAPVEHPMFCVFHDRTHNPEHQTFLEVFFTREAAEKWIEEGREHLKDPWIYAKGSHNNQEWRDVRAIILGNDDAQ